MKIVTPEEKHSHNDLNWEWVPISQDSDLFDMVAPGTMSAHGTKFQWLPPGTMVECTCGEIVVAYIKYINCFTNEWRKASWWERRRFNREAHD